MKAQSNPLTCLGLLTLTAWLARPGAAQSSYSHILDLGSTRGYSAAYGIDKGSVVGETTSGVGAFRAANLTGGALPFPDPTMESTATAIKGLYIVGAQMAGDGFTHACLFDGKKTQLLPAPEKPQSGDSSATAVNADGTAVGYGSVTTFVGLCKRPLLWREGAVTQLVGPTGQWWEGSANGINAEGMAVGKYSHYNVIQMLGSMVFTDLIVCDAVVWGGSGPVVLKMPAEAAALAANVTVTNRAYAISDDRYIVGEFSIAGTQHAFLYNFNVANAIGQDLSAGHHPDTFSSARAVNRARTVVGFTKSPGGYQYAFVWTARTGMQDLNALMPAGTTWHLDAATGIDEQGNICGYGTLNGQPHAFLLSP